MTFDLSIDFAHNFGVNNTRIANFYKHNWDRPIALSKPEFLDWQFGSSCENHCVVAMLGSEIVGVMAVNPRSFLCNNISYNGAELSTWCVNKKVRGLGVGKKILRFLKTNFFVYWICAIPGSYLLAFHFEMGLSGIWYALSGALTLQNLI